MSGETTPTCELCGEPMPPGEEMFKFHGFSGNCPKPSMTPAEQRRLTTLAEKWDGEAENYERRTDDDFTAHAMMLRYCAVQLRSAMIKPKPEHSWYFYGNGTFCTRCGAAISDH